jgi:flagellar export protein FliJ
MQRFRFRADVALDLRRRALERAERELALAEQFRLDASSLVEAAGAAIREAQQAAIPPAGAPLDPPQAQWHRFWIVRLVHEKKRQETVLASRTAALGVARAACIKAKQQCRALEKLREKARGRYDAAEAADERKLIDEVATLRMDAQRRAAGGAP